MTAYLIALLVYVDGSYDLTAYPRASVSVCESQLPANKVALQKVSDQYPGKLRMFIMMCAKTEFVETKDRS